MIEFNENLSLKEIKDLQNYESLEYSDKLRIPSNHKNTGIEIFSIIKSSPTIRSIDLSGSFLKSALKLPEKIRSSLSMVKFLFLTLSKNKESLLPPNYKFHDIDKEIKNHYVVHIGGDYAIRFRIEPNIIVLKDFVSHSERGY